MNGAGRQFITIKKGFCCEANKIILCGLKTTQNVWRPQRADHVSVGKGHTFYWCFYYDICAVRNLSERKQQCWAAAASPQEGCLMLLVIALSWGKKWILCGLKATRDLYQATKGHPYMCVAKGHIILAFFICYPDTMISINELIYNTVFYQKQYKRTHRTYAQNLQQSCSLCAHFFKWLLIRNQFTIPNKSGIF